MNELEQQIQAVARARNIVKVGTEAKAAAFLQWQQEHQELLQGLDAAIISAANEEARLRELTLAAYKETGSKKPAPEVGIREVDKLEYDATQAFTWATEHKLALKLDALAFEKTVKATPAAFPFVKIEKVATATIATNIEVK